MNMKDVLIELRAESARLTNAIVALEQLASGSAKRRGRPPRGSAGIAARRARVAPDAGISDSAENSSAMWNS